MSKMRLFVGNLNFAIDEDQLRALFSAYGEVTEVAIPRERDTKQARGFAFVEFGVRADGELAMRELHATEQQGRKITVNEAKEQRQTGRGEPNGKRHGAGRGGRGRGRDGNSRGYED